MRGRNYPISVKTLGSLYGRLKRDYSPQLLERADVPQRTRRSLEGCSKSLGTRISEGILR